MTKEEREIRTVAELLEVDFINEMQRYIFDISTFFESE